MPASNDDHPVDAVSEFHAIMQKIIAEPLEQSHRQLRGIIDGTIGTALTELRTQLERARNEDLGWRRRTDDAAEQRDELASTSVAELDARLDRLTGVVETVAGNVTELDARLEQFTIAVETIIQAVHNQQRQQTETILAAYEANEALARWRTRTLVTLVLATALLIIGLTWSA